MLQTKYWQFTIRRTCDVRNLLPTKHVQYSVIMTYQLLHVEKGDSHLLILLFSTSYIKYSREEGEEKNKWKSTYLKCILVGTITISRTGHGCYGQPDRGKDRIYVLGKLNRAHGQRLNDLLQYYPCQNCNV